MKKLPRAKRYDAILELAPVSCAYYSLWFRTAVDTYLSQQKADAVTCIHQELAKLLADAADPPVSAAAAAAAPTALDTLGAAAAQGIAESALSVDELRAEARNAVEFCRKRGVQLDDELVRSATGLAAGGGGAAAGGSGAGAGPQQEAEEAAARVATGAGASGSAPSATPAAARPARRRLRRAAAAAAAASQQQAAEEPDSALIRSLRDMDLQALRTQARQLYNLPKGGMVWEKAMLIEWVQAERTRQQARDERSVSGNKRRGAAGGPQDSPSAKRPRSSAAGC